MWNRMWVCTMFIPSSSSKGWWGKVLMWLQGTALFSQRCLPWRFHGDSIMPHYTDCTALWGQEEKQQKNGLCTELLGRRWWSLSWSFRLFWTRLSEESFSPENHIYSSSRDALSLLCQCVALRSCLFISLGTHRLWKADTENRGLSWCHRCKWDSLPVPTLNCWEKSVVVRKINLWKDIFCLTWTNLKVHFQEIQACA